MRGHVPYIRLLKDIPREMKKKLPGAYRAVFELRVWLALFMPEWTKVADTIKNVPKAENLHKSAKQLIRLYHAEFGVHFPPLNAPLILCRYIRRLALPGMLYSAMITLSTNQCIVEIYPATKNLQSLLNYTYTYPQGRKAGRGTVLDLPDVQMASLLVIATKLFFPFENQIKRYPFSSREPAAQVMNWDVWAHVQRSLVGYADQITVMEKDVFRMSWDQVDEYLDWYEGVWLDGKGMCP